MREAQAGSAWRPARTNDGRTVVTLAALVVMVALLPERHVARIEEQAAAGDVVAVAA